MLILSPVAFCPQLVTIPEFFKNDSSVTRKLRINETGTYECEPDRWFANRTWKHRDISIGCSANGTLDLPDVWPECVEVANCTSDPFDGLNITGGMMSDFNGTVQSGNTIT